MESNRFSGYRLIPAIWATLAAPTALYAAPNPYPYFVAAGAIGRSFAIAGSFLTAAWVAQTNGSAHPTVAHTTER